MNTDKKFSPTFDQILDELIASDKEMSDAELESIIEKIIEDFFSPKK